MSPRSRLTGSAAWTRAARRVPPGLLLGLSVLLVPTVGAAQERPAQAGDDALRVYLDCSGGGFRQRGHCSSDLYRQEITFVNWVREPQDAQVHVILTSQDAGGGGNRFVLDFLGRESLEGMQDEYTYSSSATDVEEETIRGLLGVLRLGLVRYAAAAGFGADLEVSAASTSSRAATDEEQPLTPEDDPWDFWVFDIDGDVRYESEDIRTTEEFGFGVSANRTTEAWKLNLRADGNFSRVKFEIPQDDGTVEVERNDQDRWTVSGFAVKSLDDHWGVGSELRANNSTRFNRELLVGLGTGVEYNYFPYSESNRRVLLARYVVSAESVQYQDTTVFDLLEETVYQHELNLSYEARETWGNANIGTGVNQYLDRPEAWSFSLRGFIRYRLFRGFSVNLNGEYRKVEDQIYLPKEALSESDIFLERRQLPTSSEIEFRLGLSYSFGSIFNNAVNERFRRGVL